MVIGAPASQGMQEEQYKNESIQEEQYKNEREFWHLMVLSHQRKRERERERESSQNALLFKTANS